MLTRANSLYICPCLLHNFLYFFMLGLAELWTFCDHNKVFHMSCSKRGRLFQRIYAPISPSSYSHAGSRTLTWGPASARSSACSILFSSPFRRLRNPHKNQIPTRLQQLVTAPWRCPLLELKGSLLFFANFLPLKELGTRNDPVESWGSFEFQFWRVMAF